MMMPSLFQTAVAMTAVAVAATSAAPTVKRFSALTRPLELAQGEVTNTYHKLAIPEGPIAVYRFEAEVVEKDADGNMVSVPTFDAYLHHHVVGSNHESYASEQDKWAPMKPANFSRSVGFGAGTECRGTPQQFYFPYAFLTVEGENEWYANVHVINTREMKPEDAHHCLECPCTAEDDRSNGKVNGMAFVEENCNAELRAENNTACSPDTYHGGLRCCEEAEFCLEHEQLSATLPKSTYYLRYTIEYANVVPENRALSLASCCDATGDMTHHGNIEYDIPQCDPEIHPGCIHTLSTSQRIDSGDGSVFFHIGEAVAGDREIELLYAVGHQHRGGMGIHLYHDKTGDLLCSSIPEYGTGHVAGDEDGYIVSMSTCTFNPPLRLHSSDIVRVVSLFNNTLPHTGAMSLMYLAIADANQALSSSVMAPAAGKGNTLMTALQIVGAVAVLSGLVIVAVRHVKKRRGYVPVTQPTDA
ncbi:TPA: hypothetical protein N0F65_001616 [Lagenidium giganteum]|uniref:Uncharacterized protein n=1 Tax=Lagenidium giganteum TaxID=4803 RepID=A0AAV2YEP3_9STRA|nr:TPA: hypothetical protein N0F65_001616 [Lagenidium giganteum]